MLNSVTPETIFQHCVESHLVLKNTTAIHRYLMKYCVLTVVDTETVVYLLHRYVLVFLAADDGANDPVDE